MRVKEFFRRIMWRLWKHPRGYPIQINNQNRVLIQVWKWVTEEGSQVEVRAGINTKVDRSRFHFGTWQEIKPEFYICIGEPTKK